VHRLRGMFAFALWDAPRRRLLLARDRLGIKPLLYAPVAGGLLFASDLRALLLHPGVDRAVDEQALACYLALRYAPAPHTLLRGVRKLPPGCTALFANGKLTVERYWDLARTPVADPLPPTEAEAAAHLRERIDECVASHLMSDVPLGAFLSGGLDSTLVTAALVRRAGARVTTFAVGYDDQPRSSELSWAAHAAHLLGCEHRELHVSGRDAAAALPRILSDLDEPVADPAAVPLWFLARRAREEVTVVLSGEGGDEIGAGYAIHGHMLSIERLRRRGLARYGPATLGRLAPSLRWRRAARLAALPLEARYRGVSRAFDRADLRRLLGDAAPAAERALAEVFAPLWADTVGETPLRRMLHVDHRLWLPDDLLAKADRMTMAASLELRVPLLDHLLVEQAWSLPDGHKLAAGEGKRMLRRAARGRVPPSILARPKSGFSTPSAAWLRGPLASPLRETLSDGDSLTANRFDRGLVAHLLDDHLAGRADRSPELWALITLELWHAAVRAAAPLTAARAAAGDE
jgi:asparagine synthase (glutamine-hydrolysing)